MTTNQTNTRTRTEWKTTKVTLHRDGKPPLTDIPAKEAVYTYPHAYTPEGDRTYEQGYSICVFVSPETNNYWVGVANQQGMHPPLFIEHGRDILCCRLFSYSLEWLPNLSDRSPIENITLETVIARIEDENVFAKLENTFRRRHDNTTNRDEDSPPSATNINSILGVNFWGRHSSGLGQEDGDLHLAIATIEKGVVEFDLENRTIKRKARVWVDLDTRKVVKATINGKQVFPE